MSNDETNNQLSMQLQLQTQRTQMQQQQIQLQSFWQSQIQGIAEIDPSAFDFKTHQLPLARIKKIMKTDEDVRMISAEAPVLFAKACEMFILELSLRSWIHTEENKRRTLQRSDIAMAITKTDVFDFLIDIVPRDDVKPAKKSASGVDAQQQQQQQLVYQQQLQQQQTAMLQQLLQQQMQTGNTTGIQWPNPQLQQQMLQQYQQRMMQLQQQSQQLQNGDASTTTANNNSNNNASANAGGSSSSSSDQLSINQRSVDV